MSHTLTIKTQFKDRAIIERTAREMAATITTGKIALYDGTTVNGIGVKLPGWTYPIAIYAATGEVKYDNYNGRWGAQSELEKFTQLYAANKLVAEAEDQGWMISRTTEANGNIKLQFTGM